MKNPQRVIQYIGTKIIAAIPMNRGEYNKYRGWQMPEGEDPDDAGYHVMYLDGYESWSPAGVFEEAYRPTSNMNFGLAIEAMKKGKKVARHGWNGVDMFLFLVTYKEGTVQLLPGTSPKPGTAVKTAPLLPHINMKTADGSVAVGWLASQTDMLSDDWFIVE